MKTKFAVWSLTLIFLAGASVVYFKHDTIVGYYKNMIYQKMVNKQMLSNDDIVPAQELQMYYKKKLDLNKAFSISEKLFTHDDRDIYSLLEACNDSAILYFIEKNRKYYYKSIEYLNKINKYEPRPKNYVSYVVQVYFFLQKDKNEIDNFINGSENLSAFEYFNIAGIYLSFENKAEAVRYLEKALMVAEEEKGGGKEPTIKIEHINEFLKVAERGGKINNEITAAIKRRTM